MSTTVIIGFAEALSAPEVAWSLVDRGFEVMAFARKGRRPALKHSRFVRVFEMTAPETDLAQAQEDLKNVLAKATKMPNTAVALLPLDDQALWLCGKTNLPERVLLVGPRGEALDLALNKWRQVELARGAGFSVPPGVLAEQLVDVQPEKTDFPVMFKPAMATTEKGGKLSAGHGWVCADAAELKAATGRWAGKGPMLLQRFIPGHGEGLFGLATAQGILAWSGHRRLRMMNPQGSGSSACTAVPHIDQEARAAAERFLRHVQWRGLFMIELLRDDSGKLWFIEFNGRAWGSMALARRQGLEYPAWAVEMAINPAVTPQIPLARPEIPVCRHLAREILYLLFVCRGARSKALVRWPSFWKALSQVCRIGRRDRWYNWRRDDPKVFICDCFATLWTQLAGTRTPP